MNEVRTKRQKAIAEMLREGPVRSQDELVGRLLQLGYTATQATVSRDLEQIGAIKVKRGGALGYALPDQLGNRDWAADRLRRIFAEWVHSVEPAGSLVIVRTPAGSAHVVSLAIDQAQLAEAAGTIAGDDTIFVATGGEAQASALAGKLRQLIGEL